MTDNDTAALHERKEELYRQLSENSKKIADMINELKSRREQRNNLTEEAQKQKILRKELSKVIKEKITKVKEMRSKLPDKPAVTQPMRGSGRGGKDERVSVGKLREEIERIETKIETSAMAFTEEQKLTKILKEKKAMLAKIGGENEREREVRARSKEIDKLKKESDVAHEAVTRFARESQEHHEAILALSKSIEDLKKSEGAVREEYNKIKEQLAGMQEIPELPGKKPRKSKGGTTQNQPSAQDRAALEEKAAEVEQKVKEKKKLTTEDLLAFQAHK